MTAQSRATVVPIREQKKSKVVAANQDEINKLALGSGTWKIEGIIGLYIRCRATTKSFRVERKVGGKIVKQNLGPITMKQAKERMQQGAFSSVGKSMEQQPAHTTFAQAFRSYMDNNPDLSVSTKKNYEYNFAKYMTMWHARPVRDIGTKREDLRAFHQRIRKEHRDSIANQVRRLLSTIYNYHASGSDEEMPAFPKGAVPLIGIKARDWAFSDAELSAWWYAVKTVKAVVVELGVKTLSPVKRAYWLTSLFTGARPMSVENLSWRDINFTKRTILFVRNKGNDPYTVPMSDVLCGILRAYRDSEVVPPSDWVFPGRMQNTHLTNVKNEKDGVSAKYHLRHTFKTTLTKLGFTNEQGKMLMGHSLGGDVATGYISSPLLLDSLRPVANALATEYLRMMGVTVEELAA